MLHFWRCFTNLENWQGKMNTRYTHNTLDVGAAISACYVIWNNPSLVSYILGAFHAITAYFGVIGTFDSGFDDTLFQAGLCAVGSLYGLLSGKHYNHCWPIHESLPEALIQLVQEQYVSEIPDSLLEILCSTGTEMSNWSEYSSFWKCMKAGGAYFVTQLIKNRNKKYKPKVFHTAGTCKDCMENQWWVFPTATQAPMLILATFFPMSEVPEDQIDIIGEFMKSTMDLADLIGFHVLMSKIPGRGELKVLVAGLGWATAEFLTTKLIPLWVGARGIEFDWKYTQLSLDTNINLVQYLTIATLIWLWSRTDLQRTYLPIVIILLVLSSYRPLVLELVSYVFGVASWSLLVFKAMYTGTVGALSLQIYLGLVKSFKTY